MTSLTIDQIFQYICGKLTPSEADLRRFRQEATDEQLREVLRCDTRDSLSNRDRQLFQEEIESRRHKELKKPHWTLAPTFWLVVVGTIAGIIAAVMAVLSWKK